MFEKLIEFFSNTYETPMPKADADHVIGALMIRAAKMRATCERLEEAMPDTVELAAILREPVGTGELKDALRTLWQIVFANGIERDEEDEVLHKVEAMLGVTPKRAKELHDEVISTKLGAVKV